MDAILTDHGERKCCGWITSSMVADLCLAKNDFPIVNNPPPGNFTECDYPGYARQAVSGWTAVATDGNGRAFQDAAERTFTVGAPGATGQKCYGYWLRDPNGEVLLYQKFDTPKDMATEGDFLKITPRIRLSSETTAQA